MAIQIDNTSLPGKTIIYDDTNGGVAIDYSSYLSDIVTQATRIADALTATGDTNVADNVNRLADSLESTEPTNLADNIAAIKTLAEGDGIRTLGAYDPLTLASAYKYMVEEASLLTSTTTSDADKAASEQRLIDIINKIKDLPKGF